MPLGCASRRCASRRCASRCFGSWHRGAHGLAAPVSPSGRCRALSGSSVPPRGRSVGLPLGGMDVAGVRASTCSRLDVFAPRSCSRLDVFAPRRVRASTCSRLDVFAPRRVRASTCSRLDVFAPRRVRASTCSRLDVFAPRPARRHGSSLRGAHRLSLCPPDSGGTGCASHAGISLQHRSRSHGQGGRPARRGAPLGTEARVSRSGWRPTTPVRSASTAAVSASRSPQGMTVPSTTSRRSRRRRGPVEAQHGDGHAGLHGDAVPAAFPARPARARALGRDGEHARLAGRFGAAKRARDLAHDAARRVAVNGHAAKGAQRGARARPEQRVLDRDLGTQPDHGDARERHDPVQVRRVRPADEDGARRVREAAVEAHPERAQDEPPEHAHPERVRLLRQARRKVRQEGVRRERARRRGVGHGSRVSVRVADAPSASSRHV